MIIIIVIIIMMMRTTTVFILTNENPPVTAGLLTELLLTTRLEHVQRVKSKVWKFLYTIGEVSLRQENLNLNLLTCHSLKKF